MKEQKQFSTDMIEGLPRIISLQYTFTDYEELRNPRVQNYYCLN